MISDRKQKIERFPVDDLIVQTVLTAPEEFLLPGSVHRAVAWMHEHLKGIQKNTKKASIWFLTKEHQEGFVDNYSQTTPSSYVSIDEYRLTRLSLLQVAFSITFGIPFSLRDQRNGALVQDIFPKDGQIERVNSSFGSKGNFAFHTDQAYNINPFEVPDIITLLCVRNEERAVTRVAHLSEILPKINASDIDILKRSRFIFYTGRSYENIASRTGSILTEINGIYSIRIGTDMIPLDKEARSALSSLQEVIESVACDIVLSLGDIVVLPNRLAVHARSPFIQNKFADKRRWLQRVFIKSI